MCHIHGPEAIDHANRRVGIIQYSIPEFFEFHFNGIHFRHIGVSDCNGLFAAVGLTRVLNTLLFGVTAIDLPTFAAAAAVITAAGCLATLLPGRRASRIDPVITLRNEWVENSELSVVPDVVVFTERREWIGGYSEVGSNVGSS